MMKRTLFVLFFLLAACTPVSTEAQRDLFVDAQNARATADAAKELAEYQERFLTATAEAPIVHITETSAAQQVQSTTTADALAMQQHYWTITAQSVLQTETAAMTSTAMAWTPTPNATSTAVFAALNAQSTQIANNVARDNLELERQKDINDFKGKMPAYAFVVVVLVLAIALMFVSRRERFRPASVDARGNVLPILDVVDGTVTDVDRNPNYRGQLSENLTTQWMRKVLQLPSPQPEITAERQDATTQRDQLLDLASRGLPEPTAQRKEQKKLAGQEMIKELAAPNLESRFKILEGESSNLDVIDGQIIQVLDADWKEAEQK